MAFDQRTWIDFIDDLDAEAMNDLEARISAGVGGLVEPITNVTDHGLVGDNSTPNLTPWNNLIAGINAGTYKSIYFPAGTYKFTGTPTAITASGVTIYGAGPGATQLTQTDNVGTFFTIGAVGDNAARNLIQGFYLVCTGTPTDYAIICPDADDTSFENIMVHDIAGLSSLGDIANIGGTATIGASSRVHFINVRGTVKTSSSLDWNRGNSAFGCKFIGCHLTSGVQTSNSQAYVHIGGASMTIGTVTTAAANDTVIFDDCIFFANPGGGGTVGIPYGFKLDAQLASVNNIWVDNGTFDGTDTAGIWFRGDSSVATARGFHFDSNRFETAAGEVIDVVHSNNGSQVAQVWNLSKNLFFYGNANDSSPPAVFNGGRLLGVALEGNHFYEMGTATVSQVAMMRCSHWSGANNHFHTNGTANTLHASYVYRTLAPNSGTAGADPDFFYTGGNVYATPGTAFFLHMAYGGGASTNRRVLETDVSWPGH